MIGEKAYQNAMRRRAELRQELRGVETFLELCERFAGEDSAQEAPAVTGSMVAREAPDTFAAEGAIELGGNALRPYIRKAILDLGCPLSRVDTVRALGERGIRVAGQDPVTNVGTVMWRAKDEFVNLKPHGYWPRDVPYAAARYDPATHVSENENDANNEVPDSQGGDQPAGNGMSSSLWES